MSQTFNDRYWAAIARAEQLAADFAQTYPRFDRGDGNLPVTFHVRPGRKGIDILRVVTNRKHACLEGPPIVAQRLHVAPDCEACGVEPAVTRTTTGWDLCEDCVHPRHGTSIEGSTCAADCGWCGRCN